MNFLACLTSCFHQFRIPDFEYHNFFIGEYIFCLATKAYLGTIHLLRQHIGPTHHVSINAVLNVSKNGRFLNQHSPSPYADIIYGWFLMYHEI